MSTVISLDFGQTLTELDCELLAKRVAERGARIKDDALVEVLPIVWRVYDRASSEGRHHPWKELMRALLIAAKCQGADVGALVDWLWEQQPLMNLWRKPIPNMIELVRELRAAGRKVIVISNSEGKLAELAAELGWLDYFDAIIDSGRLGIAKPAPGIFEHAAKQCGVATDDLVHVGDSWTADIEGALAVGARAIWFGGATMAPELPAEAEERARLRFARSAGELRDILGDW